MITYGNPKSRSKITLPGSKAGALYDRKFFSQFLQKIYGKLFYLQVQTYEE